MKRLRKFRQKNWMYIMSMKLGLTFYVMTFSVLYLTGNTGAYFNDTEQVDITIQAGTWWDKSSLEFRSTQNNAAKKGECAPINTTIKNGGSGSMQGPVNYEIWWAVKGNPKDGEKVSTGEIKPLKSGESLNLSYSSIKDGNYMFKAYQSAGHPGQGELWSDAIEVNCSASKVKKETEEADHSSDKSTEKATEPQPEQQPQQSTEPVTETKEQPSENVTEPQPNEEKTEEIVKTSPEDPQPIEENEEQKDDSN